MPAIETATGFGEKRTPRLFDHPTKHNQGQDPSIATPNLQFVETTELEFSVN